MTEAAFIGRQGVSRYFFVFEIDQGQRETALLTVNKHWAPLVFHGRTPIVSVVSCLILLSRLKHDRSTRLEKKYVRERWA